MSTETSTEANQIKDVENGKDANPAVTRTEDSVFLKRRKRRRLDLRTLQGTAREHAKVYRALAEGTITQGEALTRSRVLGTHKEILSNLDQARQLAAITEQLRAIRGNPPSGQLMIDDDAKAREPTT